MRKFVIIFTILFLILPSVASARFLVSLTKNEVTVLAGSYEHIYVKIRNEALEKRKFNLFVWPERFDKVSIFIEEYVIHLNPNEEKEIKITISAAKDAREITGLAKIIVKEIETGEIKEDLFAIAVKRVFAPNLKEVKLEKENYKMGEILRSYVVIENLGTASEEISVEFRILKAGELIYKEVKEVLLRAKEEKTVEFSFKILQEHIPGKYDIEVLLFKDKNLISSISKSFGVEKAIEYDVDKIKTFSILGPKIDIIVTNKGNDVAVIEIKEKLPSSLRPFLKFEIEPEKAIEENDEIIFVWKLTLKPNQRATISYQVIFLPVIIFILGIALFAYFSYLRIFAPSITKTSSYTGPLSPKKEITVSIEISNKSARSIRRVSVQDFVPGIMQVIKKFETLQPKIKRTEEGTYLTWKISSMKKDEERVLTYKIKPTLKIIGSIKLPPAELTYYVGKIKAKRKSSSVILGE